jgi:excisionase family DNA binding protein
VKNRPTEVGAQYEKLRRILEHATVDEDAADEGRVILDFESPAPAGDEGAAAGPHHETVELPREAVEALLEIARALSQGRSLRIIPHEAELTTQGAAELLGVSRPHLIALIDRGELDCHMVGTHRRLNAEAVLEYRARRNAVRREAVRDAQRISADLEGEY